MWYSPKRAVKGDARKRAVCVPGEQSNHFRSEPVKQLQETFLLVDERNLLPNANGHLKRRRIGLNYE